MLKKQQQTNKNNKQTNKNNNLFNYLKNLVTVVITDTAYVCNLFVSDDLFVLYVYVYTKYVGSLLNSLSIWHGVNVFHREYNVFVSYTLMKCSLQPSPQPLYVWVCK